MKPGFFAAMMALRPGRMRHRAPSRRWRARQRDHSPCGPGCRLDGSGRGTEPVYRNPKIGIVYLRAHQDARAGF